MVALGALSLSACSSPATERPAAAVSAETPVASAASSAKSSVAVPSESASSTSVALASSAAPAAGKAPKCAALRVAETERAARMLADARAKMTEEQKDSFKEQDPFTVKPPVGLCFESAAGVWLLSLKNVRVEESVELRFSLDHIDPSGARTSIVPTLQKDDDTDPKASNALASFPSEMKLSGKVVTLAGKEVFALRIEGHFIEDVSFARGRLFVAESGKIVPFAPAAGLNVDDIVDVDGDGKLDLTTFDPYDSDAESCASGFGYRITGPKLLAHATATGFSLDDAAAKAFAKKSCPKKPSRLVDVSQGYPDTSTSAMNIACLGLWGVKSSEIVRKVRAECSAIPPKPGDCSGSCDKVELEQWAAMKAPLDLSAH